MADVYLSIAEQPDSVIATVAEAMETRASEPQMRAICEAYLSDLPRPGAEVVEFGCGNGASTAILLDVLSPRRLTGVDPSPGLLERARARFASRDDVRFRCGEAADTGLRDASADIVVAHTVFSHLADPDAALAEAARLLRPGGVLAVFDGDYATNTVALFEGDPLQAAMTSAARHLIHDPYVMRALPGRLPAAGLAMAGIRAHGYVQTERPDYIRTLIARGMDKAAREGEIGDALATAFQAEADRRAAGGTFYGAILFVSLLARKTGTPD